MRAKEVTRALRGHGYGAYKMPRCLAHDDKNPSLSINQGEAGRHLLRCPARCAFRDVLGRERKIIGHRGLPLKTGDEASLRPQCRSIQADLCREDGTLARPSWAPTLPLLTMQQVMAATTFSRPSIYRLLSQGKFPAPIKLGRNRIAFVASEVDEWIASRPRAVGLPERAP